MKKSAWLIPLTVAASLWAAPAQNDVLRLHEAAEKMDWDRAVAYCRGLDAHIPELKTMKNAYYKSYRGSGGERPYVEDVYWTADQFDIDGAYAFDFSTGLHNVEFKGNRFRVMCIQVHSAY
ncbi:MAG: hypothetical protein AB7E49_09020 [Campylobacterales bacterium]